MKKGRAPTKRPQGNNVEGANDIFGTEAPWTNEELKASVAFNEYMDMEQLIADLLQKKKAIHSGAAAWVENLISLSAEQAAVLRVKYEEEFGIPLPEVFIGEVENRSED